MKSFHTEHNHTAPARTAAQLAVKAVKGCGVSPRQLKKAFIEQSEIVQRVPPKGQSDFTVVHPTELSEEQFKGKQPFRDKTAIHFSKWVGTVLDDELPLMEDIEYVEGFVTGEVYVECSETLGHWVYCGSDTGIVPLGAPDVVEEFVRDNVETVKFGEGTPDTWEIDEL